MCYKKRDTNFPDIIFSADSSVKYINAYGGLYDKKTNKIWNTVENYNIIINKEPVNTSWLDVQFKILDDKVCYQIILAVAENTSLEKRECKITLTYNNVTTPNYLPVVQNGKALKYNPEYSIINIGHGPLNANVNKILILFANYIYGIDDMGTNIITNANYTLYDVYIDSSNYDRNHKYISVAKEIEYNSDSSIIYNSSDIKNILDVPSYSISPIDTLIENAYIDMYLLVYNNTNIVTTILITEEILSNMLNTLDLNTFINSDNDLINDTYNSFFSGGNRVTYNNGLLSNGNNGLFFSNLLIYTNAFEYKGYGKSFNLYNLLKDYYL